MLYEETKEFRVWVDCVSNGFNICYYTHEILQDLQDMRELSGYSKDGYFRIFDPRKTRVDQYGDWSGEGVYREAYSVGDAVKRSRSRDRKQ